jgi:hypothetical protein
MIDYDFGWHVSTCAQLGSLSDKWGISAFMDRKTPGGDDVMRYLSKGSTYYSFQYIDFILFLGFLVASK